LQKKTGAMDTKQRSSDKILFKRKDCFVKKTGACLVISWTKCMVLLHAPGMELVAEVVEFL
jgi:hypothetical protein